MALRLTPILALSALISIWSAEALAQSDGDATHPNCRELNYRQSLAFHPKEFGAVDIDLTIDDYRNWVKKKIRSYVSLAKRGHARKEKRTRGVMTFHSKTGVSCWLRAKFRAHGDLDDHYPADMSQEPSLNVKLVDGHIFGITKFVLFRPETRNSDNEVFAATMLSQLGFLAPRTTNATLRMAGRETVPTQVIFQEKIVKEFLEAANVREGPILEGDERFSFGQKYAHLKRGAGMARISNFKWATKGPSSLAISQAAISQMNKLLFRYDKAYATKYGGNLYDMAEIARRLENGANRLTFDRIAPFEALLFAMGAAHGFAQDDRRLVYEPLTNSFLPIYYDGGATILTGYDEKSQKITSTARRGVAPAQSMLSSLDVGFLQRVLEKRGVAFSSAKLDETIAKMRARLNWMAKTDQVRKVRVEARRLYGRAGNLLSYVFTHEELGKLEICGDGLTDCRLVDAAPEFVARKLMSQTYKDGDKQPVIYFGFPRSELTAPFSGFIDLENLEIARRVLSTPNFQLVLIGDITGKLDRDARTISLSRTGASGRAVITGKSISNWSISLTDNSGHVKDVQGGEQNFDRFGLTGCLTFTDIEISQVDISARDATCEDAVNLVRVNGELRSVAITGAAFDALDADFSKIRFASLTISDAGNDCLDLSYGVYHGDELLLSRCGDKAVSVGETSVVTIENLLVNQANIGLAAKDFGTIKLTSGKIDQAKTCYELYNKKQEFSGGHLNVTGGQLDCGGAPGKADKRSSVSGLLH